MADSAPSISATTGSGSSPAKRTKITASAAHAPGTVLLSNDEDWRSDLIAMHQAARHENDLAFADATEGMALKEDIQIIRKHFAQNRSNGTMIPVFNYFVPRMVDKMFNTGDFELYKRRTDTLKRLLEDRKMTVDVLASKMKRCDHEGQSNEEVFRKCHCFQFQLQISGWWQQ